MKLTNIIRAVKKNLATDEEIKKSVQNEPLVILYFSNQSCGACEIIRSRIGSILQAYPKIRIIDIDGDKRRRLAADFQVFAAPLMLFFAEGKEVIRLGRYLDFMELERMLARYYEMVFKDRSI